MEGITDNLFESEISKAIGSKSDFAYETNFLSDDLLMHRQQRRFGSRIASEKLSAAGAKGEKPSIVDGDNI